MITKFKQKAEKSGCSAQNKPPHSLSSVSHDPASMDMSHCGKSTHGFSSATTGTLYSTSLLTHTVASKPSLIELERF